MILDLPKKLVEDVEELLRDSADKYQSKLDGVVKEALNRFDITSLDDLEDNEKRGVISWIRDQMDKPEKELDDIESDIKAMDDEISDKEMESDDAKIADDSDEEDVEEGEEEVLKEEFKDTEDLIQKLSKNTGLPEELVHEVLTTLSWKLNVDVILQKLDIIRDLGIDRLKSTKLDDPEYILELYEGNIAGIIEYVEQNHIYKEIAGYEDIELEDFLDLMDNPSDKNYGKLVQSIMEYVIKDIAKSAVDSDEEEVKTETEEEVVEESVEEVEEGDNELLYKDGKLKAHAGDPQLAEDCRYASNEPNSAVGARLEPEQPKYCDIIDDNGEYRLMLIYVNNRPKILPDISEPGVKSVEALEKLVKKDEDKDGVVKMAIDGFNSPKYPSEQVGEKIEEPKIKTEV